MGVKNINQSSKNGRLNRALVFETIVVTKRWLWISLMVGFLTKNEVAHAQANPDRCVLYIVYDIEVAGSAESPTATGGKERVVYHWAPSDDDLLALSYQYTVPTE